MRVIPPITITSSILTATTAAEPDIGGSPANEQVYSAGVSYGIGQEVISTSTHRKYESLQAANLGNPLPVLPATTTAWWLDIGPTNRYAMFDLYRNTQTISPSPLVVELTPGERVNSLALLGLDATSIVVTMLSTVGSPTETLFSETYDLTTREVLDWYDYFFEAFSYRASIVEFELPPYSTGKLRVEIINTGGDVACGACAIGSFQYIGEVQPGASSDAINYSTVERDELGDEVVLIPRRSVPKTIQEVRCEPGLVNAVLNLRTALNAVPAVWCGIDDPTHDYFEAMLVLGIARRFVVSLAETIHAVISLELEEI